MTINYDRIKDALPVESGNGRRSTIRARSDVVEVVLDCVLRRRQFKEIAQRCCVDLESLTRFRKRFITAEVEKIVLVEANKLDATSLDQEVNSAQGKIEGGIEGILKEQKRLYRTLNGMVAEGGDNLFDVLAPMMQLLRDQNKSYENLLKVYSNLRDKTTIVLGLNEHPDVQKLMDVLWVVFHAHPEAFETFRQAVTDRRIPLNVE
ncbi:hypothetical protein [Sulfitobacter sabulilitoris]|uniref:Uncharacterized protein n=1 Tax=Sulfitobacter sabulilitoris TaxID=2562655 RepID=A0A5S3PJZ7_9RHOB|nr:hypothetical protein [Sulfitobacter sabulilitoris]TMM54729.1 hypothetical protein FDT80_03885 [Sulfitobacter sabulilitoris]